MTQRSFLAIFILFLTGLTMEPLYAQEPRVPQSYTTMDDLFIPDAPFPHTIAYEKYRFEPIVLNEKGEIEYDIYVYVEPAYHAGLATPQQQADAWMQQVRQKAGSEVIVREKCPTKLAGVEAYKLVYETLGFEPGLNEDKRKPADRFIDRVFFIPVALKQMAFIRLVRKLENDSQKTAFWKDWLTFLDSLSIGPGAPHIETTKGRAPNTRRYHVRNLRFEIPLGSNNGDDAWIIENNAKRTDIWETPQGKIKFSIHISDGYEFPDKEENKIIIDEATAWAKGGTSFLKKLIPGEDNVFDYIETPFGKANLIYGYTDDDGDTKNFTLKTAYKDGKTFNLEISGATRVIEAHQKVILAWLAHFIVMP